MKLYNYNKRKSILAMYNLSRVKARLILKKLGASYIFPILLLTDSLSSCKKLVEVGEPVNSITSSEAFSTDANATSAVSRIYNDMTIGYQGGPNGYANSLTTFLAGLSADEFQFTGSYPAMTQFPNNSIQSNNSYTYGTLWVEAYNDIYIANAAIEGLQASSSVSVTTKNQLLGESKFLRAFIHFYLVNLFGDIPLMTTTSWAATSTMSRTTKDRIYQQIESDLKDAQNLLQKDYGISNGQRIRVNRSAADGLLARLYLYTKDWVHADSLSSVVIANVGTFVLGSDLNKVFLKGSQEIIWQLQVNDKVFPYATAEGSQFIPQYLTRNYPPSVVIQYPQYFIPKYYLTTQLINAFETGDQRKAKWLDSTGLIGGINYYYPNKYKSRQGTAGNVTENYVVLRLAEQYLIRAEARANENNLNLAINDLNTIRTRAGLAILPGSLTQTQVIAAIQQEQRVEFFAEWGHRWLDLKRSGSADAILASVKGANWHTYDQLWPIPLSELQVNPNLTQNAGY